MENVSSNAPSPAQDVTKSLDRHAIHAYFNVCPESPDGRFVLYFSSNEPDAGSGEIRILERATGTEKTLAAVSETEDGHRVACQQWVSGGRRVVFHDPADGAWIVKVVDIETLEIREVARGRLLGFGSPNGDEVLLYGPHWDHAGFADLETINLKTGARRTITTVEATRDFCGAEEMEKLLGQQPIKLFFPVSSPDGQRVFFKLAAPLGGNFRSPAASKRLGMVVYDLAEERFLYYSEKWRHPAWTPDSRSILQANATLTNVETGKVTNIPKLPRLGNNHPNVAPDGQRFITDMQMKKLDGPSGHWGLLLADLPDGAWRVLHHFDNVGGVASWRPPHPHPAFSSDGKRVYFNVNFGPWTRLQVLNVEQCE